ncbi:MAG: lantibiotic dehydratase C-terminal domain-containing protein, partial [Acidobacteriota bacterium]
MKTAAEDLAPFLGSAFAERSERIARAAAALRELSESKALMRPLRELAASQVHMHVNRIVIEDARRQEVLLYDFLARRQRTAAARGQERGSRCSTGAVSIAAASAPGVSGLRRESLDDLPGGFS